MPMRLSLLTLLAILGTTSLARADEPAAKTEELPDPNAGEEKKEFPIETAPKLPVAGKSIKVAVPEKKQGSSLLWKPRWQKVSTAEWVITGMSLGITVASLFVPARQTAWNEPGFLFDEPARRSLRIRSEGWRLNARDTSDVLLSISSTYPYLVDALMVAWWHRGSSEVAKQMALMDAEAMALTAAVQGAVSALASRERPYGRDCTDPTFGNARDCLVSNRYRSFFSGHTSQAFASAMLTCSHHANLPLYGTKFADRTACVSAVALALTIGSLRMVSDMHYASDVITGAVIGSAIGLAVPNLFHYRGSSETTTATRSVLANVRLIPMPTGLAVIGVFG